MFDFIADLDGWAQWLLSVGAGIALVAGFWRWLLPTWRAFKSDSRAIRDTLVGREATLDSITGEEIRPAIPGIGTRVSSIEQQGEVTSQQLSLLTRAVADMAANQERIDSLEHRVTHLETGWAERMAGRAESIQLFRTIEQVAKSADDPDDDPAA